TFVGLIRALGRIEHKKQTRAVFVKLGEESFPFAQAKEIGERLAKIKGKSIPVVCHSHQIENATLWLVSRGCSEVWVSAAGSVETVGIGAELSYLKGAFDKVGVKADMLAMGKYKSGGEALTQTGPSEDSLRNLKDTLSDLRHEWLVGITESRENPETRKKH